jgi:very-short-patch-repair endonuclease
VKRINKIEQNFLSGIGEYMINEGMLNDEDDPNNYECIRKQLEFYKGLIVKPQYPVHIYIIDFYILDDTTNKKYAIEIDGYDYHSTKEQRFKDYRRERFLLEEGYTVIRFMGSEVYTDAVGCFESVLKIIERDRNHHEKISSSFHIKTLLNTMDFDEYNARLNASQGHFLNYLKDRIKIAYKVLSPIDFDGVAHGAECLGIDWEAFIDK